MISGKIVDLRGLCLREANSRRIFRKTEVMQFMMQKNFEIQGTENAEGDLRTYEKNTDYRCRIFTELCY